MVAMEVTAVNTCKAQRAAGRGRVAGCSASAARRWCFPPVICCCRAVSLTIVLSRTGRPRMKAISTLRQVGVRGGDSVGAGRAERTEVGRAGSGEAGRQEQPRTACAASTAAVQLLELASPGASAAPEPHRVDGRLGLGVDVVPPTVARHRAIPREGVQHAAVCGSRGQGMGAGAQGHLVGWAGMGSGHEHRGTHAGWMHRCGARTAGAARPASARRAAPAAPAGHAAPAGRAQRRLTGCWR